MLERGRVIERLRLGSADGSSEAAVDTARIWPGVGPSLAVHRELAVEALREWCRVPVRTSIALLSLAASGLQIRAVLSDGSSTLYDLVVAADGVHSTVRRQLWPDVSARYGGESAWRGVVACPTGLADWSTRLCHGGNFLALPIGADLVYWGALAYSEEPFEDPVGGRARRFRDRFQDLAGGHREVLESIVDDAAIQFSPAEEVWVEDPVRGRVVLVGDACHATTPNMAQGGSMAVEDALVLAQELGDAGAAHVDAALARYAARRLPRTRYVQETTATRNQMAALPPEQRVGLLIPIWETVSVSGFAPLVPGP
jgi:2-polyprenyl-6-methoxyphenol hydroxylase-like FAD-dependent oxidoreductase